MRPVGRTVQGGPRPELDGAGVSVLLGLSCKTHAPLTPEAQLMVVHTLAARLSVWGGGRSKARAAGVGASGLP